MPPPGPPRISSSSRFRRSFVRCPAAPARGSPAAAALTISNVVLAAGGNTGRRSRRQARAARGSGGPRERAAGRSPLPRAVLRRIGRARPGRSLVPKGRAAAGGGPAPAVPPRRVAPDGGGAPRRRSPRDAAAAEPPGRRPRA